jgi:hypothetical protein
MQGTYLSLPASSPAPHLDWKPFLVTNSFTFPGKDKIEHMNVSNDCLSYIFHYQSSTHYYEKIGKIQEKEKKPLTFLLSKDR